MLLLLVFVIPRIDRCPGDLAIFSSRCFSRATRRPTLSDGSPGCPWCCDETLILACTGLTLTNTDAASHSHRINLRHTRRVITGPSAFEAHAFPAPSCGVAAGSRIVQSFIPLNAKGSRNKTRHVQGFSGNKTRFRGLFRGPLRIGPKGLRSRDSGFLVGLSPKSALIPWPIGR